MIRHRLRHLLVAAALAGAGATAVAAPTTPTTTVTTPQAADVVTRVQKFYASIDHVKAQFRQTVTYDVSGSTKESDGSVWIAKPGKMRWDYFEKKQNGSATEVTVKKSFLSNGTTLYIIEHDNKQYIKKNLSQDLMPVAVSFLYGKGDLATEFNAELDTSGKWGGKDETVLRMTPKQPSAQYKNLFLVVSPADGHVTQSIIVDAGNNVNHFRFFSPDFQATVKDSWFEFDPRSVPNYRAVDADAQQGSGVGSGARL